MTIVVPGSPEFVEAARRLPRQYREPVPIPDGGPDRATQGYGTTDGRLLRVVLDPATGWPTRPDVPGRSTNGR